MGKQLIIILMLLTSSVAFADIELITVSETNDHQKLATKLNQIIKKINSEMSQVNKSIDSKATKEEVSTVKIHYEVTARDLNILRGNLSGVRKKVGDPTGTVTDVRTKFLKLMDTLDSAPQHVEVTP